MIGQHQKRQNTLAKIGTIRGVMPSTQCKIGVWEHGKFIGVVLFGIGAGNSTRGEKYGLERRGQVAELVRVALKNHDAPVSKIIKVALKIMKAANPGIRLVISFADEMAQGHHGGIYQAGNWIYTGAFTCNGGWWLNGKIVHNKTVHSRGWKLTKDWLSKNVDSNAKKASTKKHRYLMPMDKEMRERIIPLAKPYPKRDKQAMTGGQPEQRRGSTDHHAPTHKKPS